MIKLRGFSVVPSAVEQTIVGIPGVDDCAVITVLDETTGQPDHIVACVVPTIVDIGEQGSIDLGVLRTALKQRLAPEAVPARFVSIEQIPVHPSTGKRDERQLHGIVAETERAGNGEDLVPLGAVDAQVVEQLRSVWSDVLGRAPSCEAENFFDVGGHSLKAGELALALQRSLKRQIDVADIYAHPTFAELSTLLDGAEVRPPVTGVSRSRRQKSDELGSRDIAVVGMSCRFAGADNADELWQAVRDGREAFRDADGATGEPSLKNVDLFDPDFWGMSRREAVMLDPQHRLFLEAAWQALEHSGHRPSDCERQIGVYAGCYLPTYLTHHLGAKENLDPSRPSQFHLTETTNDKDYLAQRVAYLMDLHGPAMAVQSSCSTGLVAICQAADALRAGRCRMAIAGAASLTFPQCWMGAVEGHVISPTAKIRTFDAKADGTFFSDGVGAVVLRPLSDAEADGDTIYAVLKGYAVNNDGKRKAGFSTPSLGGQTDVICSALDDADVDPADVGYVETHGTGTRIGDPLEVMALRAVYDVTSGRPEDQQRCALGSVKPNVGHANIASGVAGVIKTIQALRHGEIPPVTNFETENPELRLAGTRLHIPKSVSAWTETGGDHLRTAGVSCFGIGGTNAHAIFEAPSATVHDDLPFENVVGQPVALRISARTQGALITSLRALADVLERDDPPALVDVAFTLAEGREAFEQEVWVEAGNHAEAVARLRAVANYVKAGREVHQPTEREQRVPPNGRRVALPTYPFERVSCWPSEERSNQATEDEQPGTVAQPSIQIESDRGGVQELDDWFYVPVDVPIPLPPALPGSLDKRHCIVITAPDGSEPGADSGDPTMSWADRLCEDPRLTTTTMVSPFYFGGLDGAPSDAEIVDAAEDFAKKAVGLHLEKCGAKSLLDLVVPTVAGLLGGGGRTTLVEEGAHAAFALISIVRALRVHDKFERVRVWLVASQPEPGSDELQNIVAGVALVIGQELLGVEVRCLTHDDDHRGVAWVIGASVPPSEPILKLGNGRFASQAMQPYPLSAHHAAAGRARLKPGSVHLIIGGLGRIGLALADHLVRQGCDVVLTTRKTIDQVPAAIRDKLQAYDGRVRIVTMDATSGDQILRCLDGMVGRKQPLGMVFQCAGLADLKSVEQQTVASLAAELAPKITVVQALQSALDRLALQRDIAPSHVVLFSSLAAELGGVAMSGYAAANRFLDRFAAEKARDHDEGATRWISIAWDDWSFTYEKEQTAAYARTRAHLAMPVERAIDALHRILGDDDVRTLAVSATDLRQRWAQWRLIRQTDERGQFDDGGDDRCAHPATNFKKFARVDEGDVLAEEIGGVYAEPRIVSAIIDAYRLALGAENVTPWSDYYDLGGDSLLAVDVLGALEARVSSGLRPQLPDILEFPTPKQLAEVLVARGSENQIGAGTVVTPESGTPAEPNTT
ncbi:MAG: SDR family NAD(P)-dependent oxidoreductase [Pseudomonadota bacterium]